MPPKKLVAQPQLRRVHAVFVAKQFRVRMKPCSVMVAASNGYTVIVPALPFSSTRPSLTTTIPFHFPAVVARMAAEEITAPRNLVEAMKFEMVQLKESLIMSVHVAHYFFMEYFAIILSCL